jgi:hypothetical protein
MNMDIEEKVRMQFESEFRSAHPSLVDGTFFSTLSNSDDYIFSQAKYALLGYKLALEHLTTTNQSLMAEVEKLRDGSALPHLQALESALRNSFISSWQSTAGWQAELDAASDYLALHAEEVKP